MRYIGDPRVPEGYMVPASGPWFLAVRDPGEPPIKPLVFEDRVRHYALQAFNRDVLRAARDTTAFRAALRFVLAS